MSGSDHSWQMERLLTVAEAARVVNYSERSIYRRIAAGELPAVRVGPRLLRIVPEDLAELVRPTRRELLRAAVPPREERSG